MKQQSKNQIAKELGVSFGVIDKATKGMKPDGHRRHYDTFYIDRVRPIVEKILKIPTEIPEGCSSATGLVPILKVGSKFVTDMVRSAKFPEPAGFYRNERTFRVYAYYHIETVKHWHGSGEQLFVESANKKFEETESGWDIPRHTEKASKRCRAARDFNHSMSRVLNQHR